MLIRWLHRYERTPGKWVFVPSDECKADGKLIKDAIEKKWQPPNYYFHLRIGGHVAALRSHVNGRFFLRLDVQDFFGSVSRSRVTRCLKQMFEYAEARRMANVSTVKHPNFEKKVMLPYGYIQSPVLASLALYKSALGSCLERLKRQSQICVSVYMDDIIVSSINEKLLTKAQHQLESAAAKARFVFHPEKIQGPANKITAFNIELAHGELAILPERLQQFIASYRGSDSLMQKNGILGYVYSVNSNQAAELLSSE